MSNETQTNIQTLATLVGCLCLMILLPIAFFFSQKLISIGEDLAVVKNQNVQLITQGADREARIRNLENRSGE